MIYVVAIYNTFNNMGAYYSENIYKWLKTALWNAPFRLYLDIQLEQISIERNLSKKKEMIFHLD
jgi:hypothetical protein